MAPVWEDLGDKAPAVPGLLHFSIHASHLLRPNASGIGDTWGESAGRSADDEVVVQVPSLQGRHRGHHQARIR
jgi:hypothetical protein